MAFIVNNWVGVLQTCDPANMFVGNVWLGAR